MALEKRYRNFTYVCGFFSGVFHMRAVRRAFLCLLFDMFLLVQVFLVALFQAKPPLLIRNQDQTQRSLSDFASFEKNVTYACECTHVGTRTHVYVRKGILVQRIDYT